MIASRSCAQAASSLDRVDRAERVRDGADRDDLHAPAALDLVERLEHELAVRRRCGITANSAPVRRAMYCHGTKFEWCSSSVTSGDVAGAEVVEPPRVGDEVQALGRVADEDHLAGRGRVDERAHLLAGALVAGRRALGERGRRRGGRSRTTSRRTPAWRRAPGAASARVRGVEVGERLAVADLLLEDREVGPEARGVEPAWRYGDRSVTAVMVPVRRARCLRATPQSRHEAVVRRGQSPRSRAPAPPSEPTRTTAAFGTASSKKSLVPETASTSTVEDQQEAEARGR